ncbi:MAG TPA: hypothetical protein VFN52_06935 [Acidiferrobacteraceae bacterium]|nr:hypothetical protein [Acidiferrobacteraceae bacterium]
MPKAFSSLEIVRLDHVALLEARGADAAGFLHGQLTAEVQGLAGEARLAAYCTAQGRVLTLFLVIPTADGYRLRLRATLADSILKRLRMYVLRAKVELSRASGLRGIGLQGVDAEQALESVSLPVPAVAQGVAIHNDSCVLRRHGEVPRFEVWADTAAIESLLLKLGPETQGPEYWVASDIRAGLPEITPETSEQFVPQMLNLDALGGISLTKGCYPGQEIVARTHYLGRLKQRMYRATTESALRPTPGMALYAPNFPGQAVGHVLESCGEPPHFELLAVMQMESARIGELHLATPEGPRLQLGSLPYPIPGPSG